MFNIRNDAGFVNVIIDINGYHTKTSLADLASRLTAAEAAIDANATDLISLDAREPFAVTARDDTERVKAPEIVVSVQLTAPVA